ncbi:MAG: hypothetical protein LUQ38_05045 [Methanotrichaceae archaeon]|nr:hypothetical protein [Methanotrichaceae archaeon]
MGNMFLPKGVKIWTSVSICLCLMWLAAADATDPLSRIKEFHSAFINHDRQLGPSLMKPQLFDRDPELETFPPDLMPHYSPVKEHIAMNNSHPEQQVKNMYALNTNMQRDIIFDDAQSGDAKDKGLKNSLDITINGNVQGQSKSNDWLDGSSDDLGIENLVDNALSSYQYDDSVYHQSRSGSPAQQRLGNYMNIDVSGINVQAINTVEGGSAVATSNVEIKPVQIINCPPEVEEKLK